MLAGSRAGALVERTAQLALCVVGRRVELSGALEVCDRGFEIALRALRGPERELSGRSLGVDVLGAQQLARRLGVVALPSERIGEIAAREEVLGIDLER